MTLRVLTHDSGLGAGISTNAFIKHGVSTTIVEIDQAVYDAATEYFGLKVAEPEKVHITDGRGFVIQTRRALEEARQAGEPVDESGLYDYVVHDLFSGGGVPGHLFTLRFWQDLRQIIKSDAVVAVVSFTDNVARIYVDQDPDRILRESWSQTLPRPST